MKVGKLRQLRPEDEEALCVSSIALPLLQPRPLARTFVYLCSSLHYILMCGLHYWARCQAGTGLRIIVWR